MSTSLEGDLLANKTCAVHNLCGDYVHVVELWWENSSWRPGLAARSCNQLVD
jgi:hypothetical protein